MREGKYGSFHKKMILYDIIDERRQECKQYVMGSYTYNCSVKASGESDLIIVPVNSFQLVDALKILKKQAPEGKYLIMTLNWEGTEDIDKILSRDQYILGYGGGGGTFKDKLLWANLGDDITLGVAHDEQNELLKQAVGIFTECGIKPEVPDNMLHWLWIHNVCSAPLGVGLSKHEDMMKLVCDEKLVKVCFGAMNECFTICGERGVELENFPQVQMYAMPFEQIYQLFRQNVETNPVMKRFSAHAVESIGEMTENFKKMYASGKEMSLDMPNMDYLNRLIKDK